MRLCNLACRSVAAAAALLVVSAAGVEAQVYESVGVRAQGMGGAFVAVADDETASWWNPAGLAHGPLFGSQIEYGALRQPSSDRDASGLPRDAWQSGISAIAVGYPALGLSYYRLRISEIQPSASTPSAPADRQDQGTGDVRLRSLVLNQFGATVGQSVGDHVVLGSTLKLLRGSVGAITAAGADATLNNADTLNGSGQTRFDLDVGVMVAVSHVKLGLAVKNLTKPTFGSGDDQIEMGRQARAGISFGTTPSTKTAGATIAVDADLTRTATVVGDQRHVAAGIEAWSPGHKIAVRGGITTNTVGDAVPSASAGASLRVHASMFVDAQKTVGSDRTLHGWGAGIRVTF
jgi:hypothetical protein